MVAEVAVTELALREDVNVIAAFVVPHLSLLHTSSVLAGLLLTFRRWLDAWTNKQLERRGP